MKLKLTPPALARIAELLVESVVRGHREDIPLRDHVLQALREVTDQHAHRARRQQGLQAAADQALRPSQPHAWKGV